MEKTELQYEVPVNLDEARSSLKIAKEAFNRSPGYQTAQAMQIYQRIFDAKVQEERDSWFTFEGMKGVSDLSPEEILTSAIKEIVSRGRELSELYKGIEYAPTSYVRYFHTVAEQCLKDVGIDPDSFNELSIIRGDN